MNIIAAAKVTRKYVNYVCEGPNPDKDFKDPTLQLSHQLDILESIIAGEVEGEKAHRWFGWAQGVLAANGIGDMNVFRAINYACGLQEE